MTNQERIAKAIDALDGVDLDYVDLSFSDVLQAACEALDLLRAIEPEPPADPAALRLLQMLDHGGSIVSSASLSAEQIVYARAGRRMVVTKDGLGYVYTRASSGASGERERKQGR